VDQKDQGDHNPPWWTRTGFYILLMERGMNGESGGTMVLCVESGSTGGKVP